MTLQNDFSGLIHVKYSRLLAGTLPQVFHSESGEGISVHDFPHYVKKKGKGALEEEYEVNGFTY